MLEKAGGICLMLENESSGKAIYDTAMEILGDSTKREECTKLCFRSVWLTLPNAFIIR